jgi:tetratricopeptide (TPR) repeat protein
MNILKFKRDLRVIAGVICILVIALSSVFAQRIMAGVRGKVSDIDGNPLANVKIILFDKMRGTRFEFKTNKNGKFFRMGLAASLYEVTYQLEGYQAIKMELEIKRDKTPFQEIVLLKFDKQALLQEDFEIGNKLFMEGKYLGAIAIFQEIVKQVPDYVEAYHKLALCFMETNESDKAIPYLEKAVELKPGFVPYYLTLGEMYLETGKADAAIEYFTKAVELQPDNAEVFFKMGKAYCTMQKYDKAVEALGKSIELEDSYAYSYYQIGIAYDKLENREKMIENFEKFLEMKRDAPEALHVKELIEQAKEQLSKKRSEN